MIFQSENCEETLIWACIGNSKKTSQSRITTVFLAKVDYVSRFAGTSLEVPYLEIFALVYCEEFAYPTSESCLIMTIGFIDLHFGFFTLFGLVIKVQLAPLNLCYRTVRIMIPNCDRSRIFPLIKTMQKINVKNFVGVDLPYRATRICGQQKSFIRHR